MDWVTHFAEELSLLIAEHHEPMLRLVLAAALGGIIGLEREASGKPAGFRTNLLICLGAALITELSASIAADLELPGGIRSDPGRIAAQIVSGIGFLGAGTILHARGSVTGLTTAATLWVVAAIGMAAGAGAYVHAIVATVLVMVALMMLGRFEDHLIPHRPSDRVIRIVLDPRPELVASAERLLREAGVHVSGLDVERDEDVLIVSFSTQGDSALDEPVRQLLRHPGVRRVSTP
jgi:putative Mg2+ transporter-C (MgtC) family protein